MRYDHYTRKILTSYLQPASNCIDVGSHKGEILELMLRYAPLGKHLAFEPIPDLYHHLIEQYGTRAMIYPYALSDEHGKSSFQWVKNAPEYSGLRQRNYGKIDASIIEIPVEMRTLDELLSPDQRVDLVKIDVEGAELKVLRGAVRTLARWKPLLIFEFGMGAANHYGSRPEEVYQLLHSLHMEIRVLGAEIASNPAMNLEQFVRCYHQQQDYYFLAISQSSHPQ